MATANTKYLSVANGVSMTLLNRVVDRELIYLKGTDGPNLFTYIGICYCIWLFASAMHICDWHFTARFMLAEVFDNRIILWLVLLNKPWYHIKHALNDPWKWRKWEISYGIKYWGDWECDWMRAEVKIARYTLMFYRSSATKCYLTAPTPIFRRPFKVGGLVNTRRYSLELSKLIIRYRCLFMAWMRNYIPLFTRLLIHTNFGGTD